MLPFSTLSAAISAAAAVTRALTELDPPDLGAAFHILGGDAVSISRPEGAPQRLWVVIADDHQDLPGEKLLEGIEDESVSDIGRNSPHVDGRLRGCGIGFHGLVIRG